LIIVFDEFPNLITENKSLLSKFQKIWDEILKNTTIILCGSSISMMESYLLDHKSPLYGRRTGQLFIMPLKARHILYFGINSIEDAIRVFGITDGIPGYIKDVCYRLNSGERLEEVFQPDKALFAEAEVLIKSELRDPTRYFKILKAIAFSNNKFGEIVNYTGFPAPTVSKYLSNLINLHIVNESYPVLVDRERTRNRRYHLSDNYVDFYFRFIYPNKSEIISADGISGFEADNNRYLGRIFEKVSEEFLELNIDMLPFRFNRKGRWWLRYKEIDIVALNDNTREILFLECKWSGLNQNDAEHILELLKKKSGYLKWNNDNRIEHFGIIAKKIQDKETFRAKGFVAFDLDDFYVEEKF
jgi:AAA+ ATPase superfamily predicted ATPase